MIKSDQPTKKLKWRVWINRLSSLDISDPKLALIMVIPTMLIILVFAIIPMLQGFYASFFQIESATLTMQFNGLENYQWLLKQSLFWESLWRSFLWVSTTSVVQLFLGIAVALILHQELKARNLARGLVLFPYLIPAVVISLTWRFILDPTLGIFNRVLMDIGILKEPVALLTNPKTALWFIIIAGIWKYTPFVVMMTLARLQVIPVELEEAAKLDGANAIQVFRYITLPWLMPVIIVTMLLRTIWTFRQYDIVYLFAFGGPLFATTTLPVLVKYLAFDAYQIGPAAATSTIMVIVMIAVSSIYFKFYNKAEERLN
ncbi:MAG: sugar ABC transporter permease [Anaerolineae bacterium]|nr:sugar ABC transporter permease [Anaerolineae bacterium]MDK1081385.1 sugar ABC transporter permease [Anaerolineae bacterium]